MPNCSRRPRHRPPCTNGDVAVLSKFTNTKTKPSFTSLALKIIPKDRAEKSYVIAYATGDFLPPQDDEVKGYLASSHADCRNADYPSLEAMMQQITKHYWAERHKDVH